VVLRAVLSARLGLGKATIKAADAEEAAAVLGGAVTPLAAAAGFVLLLDIKAMAEGAVTVGSLAPDASVSFATPSALQAAIK
jgi:prolyl-tRNA editing enzyme YbaK/EbsC (Cys-tRNA(Pro) deacylase)